MPGDSSAATTDRRNHSLYRMRDISGRLLYVGRSNNGLRRFMEHSKDKTWWREVATIDVEHVFCSLEVISALEMETIKAERPLYNVAGNVAPAVAPRGLPAPVVVPDADGTDKLIGEIAERAHHNERTPPIDPLTGRAALGGRVRRIDPEGGTVSDDVIQQIGKRYAALDDQARYVASERIQAVRINPERGGQPTRRRAALVLCAIISAENEDPWPYTPDYLAQQDLNWALDRLARLGSPSPLTRAILRESVRQA